MGRAGTKINPQAQWKRNLTATWVAEFVAIGAFTVVAPLLPLYVQELGVQGEEARVWAGTVLAAPAISMALFAPLWGLLGDRYGRKVMIIRALLGGSVVVALMGAVRNTQQLAALRLVQGALTGSVTAANALVASSTPRRRVGYALGMLWVAVYAGNSAGPILGGVIADAWGLPVACYVAGGLLFLAGIAVAALVREERRSASVRPVSAEGSKGADPTTDRPARPSLARLPGLRALGSVLTARLLTRMGALVLSPVLPFVILEITPEGAPVASITGLVSGAGAASGALGALWLGRLGDRKGHRAVLAVCAVVAGLSYLPQSGARTPAALLGWQAVTGLAMGGILTCITASLARLAPEGREGVIYGVEGTVSSIASVVGPMAGSLLTVWYGLRSPFFLAAGLYFLAALTAAGWRPPEAAWTFPEEALEQD